MPRQNAFSKPPATPLSISLECLPHALIKPDSLFALYTNVRKILHVIELGGAHVRPLIALDEHSLSEYYFSVIE
jgi:hypothetical protein